MDAKIAREEHWAIDKTLQIAGQPVGAGALWDEMRRLLVEFRDQRLAEMDSNGIELTILGLNTPALQAILDPAEAADVARRANDTLATEVALNPGRFAGFAGLPMQDPEAAALELLSGDPVAVALIQGNAYEDAIAWLQGRGSREAEDEYLLGLAYEATGQLPQARIHYEEAHHLDSGSSVIQEALERVR